MGKTIHFGVPGNSDDLHFKDNERKQRYLKWHMKNENWQEPSPGFFFLRSLCWNQKTMNSSINDRNQGFNIHAKLTYNTCVPKRLWDPCEVGWVLKVRGFTPS